ncbi:MAG: dihydropteroate synthase [Calditrichaeota bacterium]|nr:dihydropteroate synthase [Calditrichota bacterium]
MIYITNDHRRNKIAKEWELPGLFTGDYLFKLDDLKGHQVETLLKLGKNFSPYINVLKVTGNTILIKILPDQLFFDSISTLNVNNNEINQFLLKLAKYYTQQPKKCWKYGQIAIDFSHAPLIMGILNVTPDSFSDGGQFFEKNKAIEQALQMIEQGADIIDVGGESTRPGSEQVSLDEELNRVIPVIEEINKLKNIIISIDTYKNQVAETALKAGAHIINDISGTLFDAEILGVIEKYKCPAIIMHIKGTPKSMQIDPQYDDLHSEIYNFLDVKNEEISKLNNGQVIIDPGFGFGKTVNNNFELLRDLKDLTFIGQPLLVGVSRKSFIGKSLQTDVNNRIMGSVLSEIYAYLGGADIWRVHDIPETKKAKILINDILAA